MSDPTRCVGCAAVQPETTPNDTVTLISATSGWRLTRRELPGGVRTIEWRCPECWRKHKALTRAARGPASQ
jgi:hypothetical protein